MPKYRILIFAANPSRDLHLEEEIDEINDALRRSRYNNLIEVESRHATRIDDLTELLSEHDPQVVHFSCHGLGPKLDEESDQGKTENGPERHLVAQRTSGEGALVFIADNGSAQSLSESTLLELFKGRRGRIRVVVLNACQTQSQAEAIRGQIECVMGTAVNIRDDYARVFSARFYRTLGNGDSVQQAYDDARFALKAKGATERDMPILLTRTGVEAKDVFLVDVRVWWMRVWVLVWAIVRKRPRLHAAALALGLAAATGAWFYLNREQKMSFDEVVQCIEAAKDNPQLWEQVRQQVGEVNWDGVVVTASLTGPFATYRVKPAGVTGDPRPDQIAFLNLASPGDFKPLKAGDPIKFKGRLSETGYGANGLRISDVMIKDR